ncbi:DNA-binding transcriptional regulator, LacI/PurR family [Pedococcus dokdonensis]|uniref:DNA-binding transcriptional regulator, LacI/PurR family n=1 Tax=Pedococcus dokdonensis TaxID=443156 RepID=A0A1H0N4P2_9MICO|nr:substrate-binding domain-containing protein [Pedococcus dokdonensis]SDO87592.1 DNA-binding transcriptional regulator, LacI/PurR family [Pedococcus dokdonensis]
MASGPEPTPSRATIVDVATAAGVSRQTVSNAVNHPDRVAPGTLQRVHREIERLGFRPNAAAQQLRRRKTSAYGFELNPSGAGRVGHVLDRFLLELTVAAPAHGCHVVTFAPQPPNPMTGYERILTSGLVDGFILGDTVHGDPRPAWLLQHDVPFVTFGRIWDEPHMGRWVDVDGQAGMRLAVAHLLEQGYTSVAYLGYPAGSALGDDRRAGWLAGLADAGLADSARDAETVEDLTAATTAADRLLEGLGRDGAILCASDLLALGVLRAARNRDLQPGRDLGVVGFDDSDLAEVVQLTSVRQPLQEAAAEAWRIVHAKGTDLSLTALLTPTLAARQSSSRHPQSRGT